MQEYASMLENANIIVKDMGNRIIYWNRGAEDIYGWTKEEATGKISHQLLHTIFPESLEAIDSHLQQHGYWEGELIKTKRDGTRVVVASRWTLYKDADGKPRAILEANNDITLRQQAEKVLQESEEKYRLLFNSGNDAIFVFPLDEPIMLPGIFTEVNNKARELLGYTREELLQLSPFDLEPPEKHEYFPALVEKIFTEGNFLYETEAIAKDGRLIPIEINLQRFLDLQDRPAGLAIARDITLRKRAEEVLRESQEQLQLAQSAARTGIWDFNNLTNELTWSEECYRLFGLTPHNFKPSNENWLQLIHPDDRKVIRDSLIQWSLEDKRESSMTYRIIRPDGKVCWMEARGQTFHDDTGRPVRTIGICLDITERKRAEEALRESEALLHSVFDYMHDAMIILNWDGSILFANQAAARIIGLERPEEVVGHNMVEYLHPDSLQKAAEDLEAVKADKMGFLSEYQLCSVTGRCIWVESVGGKIIFRNASANLVCIRDITDRKQAEAALRESEERFKNIYEQSPIGIELYDSDGQLLHVNRACLEIFGVSAVEEIKGLKLFEDPNVTDEVKERLLEGELVRYETAFDFEKVKQLKLYDTTKSGIIYLDVVMTPLGLKRKGYVEGYLLQVQDITEHKRLEARLIHSAKMASLGVMAGGIAHEIRNPLGVCLSAAQFLLEDPHNRVLRKQCADKIYSNVHRAARIIEGLLKFARGSGDDLGPVNLNEALEATLSLIEHKITLEGIELSRELAEDVPPVIGSSSLLQQVFLNIILNAANAMPEGGKLTISTLVNPEGKAEIRFADTGCGIPQEHRDNIFAPFFTTMSVGQGTGLGLSVSYEIIQQHGGSIEVESTVGAGSTFTVKLPLTKDDRAGETGRKTDD